MALLRGDEVAPNGDDSPTTNKNVAAVTVLVEQADWGRLLLSFESLFTPFAVSGSTVAA